MVELSLNELIDEFETYLTKRLIAKQKDNFSKKDDRLAEDMRFARFFKERGIFLLCDRPD